MKKILLVVITLFSAVTISEAGCLTCGGLASESQGGDAGPTFSISLGAAQYGQSAGEILMAGSVPNAILFTPAMLKYDAAGRPDVCVLTTNVIATNFLVSVSTELIVSTNIVYWTNDLGGGITSVTTNPVFSVNAFMVTNTTTEYSTNLTLRQVFAPQALADIPPPLTDRGYVINFYYPTNVVGTNGDGTHQISGSAFSTWIITNLDSVGFNKFQVSETTPTGGLLKQWTYTYSTSSKKWTLGTMAGIQKNMSITNVDESTYQIINTIQYSNAPIVQQTKTTYQVFNWGVAPIQVDVGQSGELETTTYTYHDPSILGAGNLMLKHIVVNPDGSQIDYAGYNTNGNPTTVYYTFQDDAYGRRIEYEYDPAISGISSLVDDGTINPTVPRQRIEYVQGYEVSHQYTVFPSVGVRLDIQCTTNGADWNNPLNLVTTNRFYTSGTNQFALQSVISPDETMTVYDYNWGIYRTNITVSGRPDSSYSYIVDGTSNRTVINEWGNAVSTASWDVKSGLLIAQKTYGNFDNFGRPQKVTHLDGTSETNVFDCCGLNYNIDRNGVKTVYLYDADKRQYGYQRYDNGIFPITYQNTLDAAGRVVKTFRVGTDSSVIKQSESLYDSAGRLIAQTNALNGATTYVETTDGSTGGLIRTTTYPNGGTRIDSHYLDGTQKSVAGTAVHPVRYEYGFEIDVHGNYGTYTKEIKMVDETTDSSEWTKTYTDMAGRTTEILYADSHYSQSFYNSKDQLSKQIDPDNVTTFYTYNAKGELAYTAISMAGASATDIDWNNDRITWTTNDVTTVRRSRTFVWAQNGVDASTPLSSSETSANGLQSWQVRYGEVSGGKPVTNSSTTSYSGSSRSTIDTAPDGSYTTNSYSYGRLISSKRFDSGNNQIGGTSYTYDAHGRQYQVTDARNGATTYEYNNADQIISVAAPMSQTTATLYDSMMRPYSVVQPDGTTVTSAYLLTGELGLQYGSRTYPVAYSYDYTGRMMTMTNWSSFSGMTGTRATTWNYESQRGFLASKAYDDGNGPSYTYTPGGRLASRSWVRGINTSYNYDTAGSLTNILYSDATPAVTNYYDRLGRLSSVVSDGMTETLTYNLANELLTDSFSGGTLAGLSITNGYDTYLRRTNLTALGSGVLSRTSYGYDTASRLQTVADGNNTATYSYLANSPLVSQILFRQSGSTRMTTTNSFDYLNRRTFVSSQPSASGVPAVSFNYNYNTANQRTKNTLVDGSYWIYQYDTLGQVTSGTKYFADGTLVPGQQFGYGFDDIGNRTQTTAGGDAAGVGLRLASYSANNLNQITSRDYPGTNDVLGAALATNAVTVNGQTAWRKGEYFWSTVKSNNTASAQWEGIKVVSGGNTNNGNLYVPQTPEQFKYDADGNLTNDGRWAYTWDGENRLVGMTNNTSVGPQYQLTFAYDAKGRRIQKMVATNGVALSTNNFLYDGWNLVAETRPDNSLIRSYVWGTDLSGTSQGAGGVGGLLEISYYGSSTTNCFPAYDGNGNIMALVNAADGTVAANYDYAAFGEPIRITGVMARNNPFRFSTKYADDESDLLYYGYRYYKPSTGTWPNRDPLTDYAFFKNSIRGLNKNQVKQLKAESLIPAYDFARNDPIDNVDTDGRIGTIGVCVIIGGVSVCAIGGVYAACANHLYGIQAEAIKDTYAEMKKLDPDYDSGLDGVTHQGSAADALHHCIGACLANKKPCFCLGREKTKQLIQDRENHTGFDLAHDQDFANNVVGFGIKGDCVQSCVDSLNNGGLSCYKEGDASLSPCKSPKKN